MQNERKDSGANNQRIPSLKVYDLSHSINQEMPTYVGEPKPEFHPYSTIEKDKVNVTKITMSSHTGTHVDAPKHFLHEGQGIDRIPLATFAGDAITLDLSRCAGHGISSDDLKDSSMAIKMEEGDILLLYTGTSDMWGKGDSASTSFTYLDPSGADWIVRHQIRCVGIDSFSVEKYGFEEGESHKKLLSNGIGIVEGLNSDIKEFIGTKVFFVCLPLNLKDMDGSPARAAAFIRDS